ncbi:MAG: LamG-like jellyroll fold domain-containing protein, partial [Alphaproteobacteria bacterium]
DWSVTLTKNGEIAIDLENADDETIRVVSSGAGITDTDWHAVSVAYDSVRGVVKIYVDGAAVGEAAFSGETPPPGYGFFIGDPWGSSFNGQIRGLEIRGDEPEADAPPPRHAELMQGETFDSVSDQPDAGAPDSGQTDSGQTDSGKSDGGETDEPVTNEGSGGTDEPSDALLDIRFTAEGPEDVSLSAAAIALSRTPLAAESGALRLTDDVWAKVTPDGDQLYSLQNLSISFGLKRDSVDAGVGSILRLHGDWMINLTKSGEIAVSLENDEGETLRMTSVGANIDDLDWHAVSFVYDSTADLARIYVDGAVVAESVFSGDTPPPGHGFFIGNPWGASFNGQIRGIEVRGDEPDGDAPPTRHVELMQGENFATTDTSTPDTSTPDTSTPDTGAGSETPDDTDAPVDEAEAPLLDLFFTAYGPNDVSGGQTAVTQANWLLGRDAEPGAYHLTDDAWVRISALDQRLDSLDQLSITFGMKRDSADGGGGDIMRLHGDWMVSVTNSGEIVVDLANEAGQKVRVVSDGAGIDDTDWHAVSFVYDSVIGVAKTYVDGEEVASAAFSGMTPDARHDFYIGDPWGSSFNGQIRGIEVRGDEQAADAPPARHADRL